MPSPSEEYRALLEERRRHLQPERLTRTDLGRLAAEWAPRVRPSGKDFQEEFSVALPDGSTTGVAGPRWLFHLFGIPHHACDVGLSTPGGLVLLQRRSPDKQDNPDLWDLAVTGHVSGPEAASPERGYLASALRETAEELGLEQAIERRRAATGRPDLDVRCFLVGGRLDRIGAPRADPPDPGDRWWHLNVEVRQLFGGVLTGEGLALLALQEAELAGIYLCTPREAQRLHDQESDFRLRTGGSGGVMAPGGYQSLTHYLAWLRGR